MHLTLFGEVQLFLLIAVTSASFLYWINHKYKSLNRQIIRAIDIPVYLLNRQGIVVKLLNTPTEKANRLPFLNPGVLNINNLVTDADECRKYMTSLLRVLNTRTSDSLTLKIRIESGEKLYIAVRMVYLNRNYVIAFIRDITEDEVQRRENEKYRFFLESILENLPIATTVKDKNDEGRYLIWNKKAAEMMEVPAEDIVGHYEEEFNPLMQDNFIQETDKEVEESEIPQSYIKHFVNPKGREYILSFHKTLVSYNKGKERWIVSSALDITELLAAKEKAEEANRLNKDIARHVKARFCLNEGTHYKYHDELEYASEAEKWLQMAATESDKLITSGRYEIYNTGHPQEDYFNMYRIDDKSDLKEAVLYVDYKTNIREHNMAAAGREAGCGFSKSFVESFLCSDGLPISLSNKYLGDETMRKETANRDPRLKQLILTNDFPTNVTDDLKDSTFVVNEDEFITQHCFTGYRPIKGFNPIYSQALYMKSSFDGIAYRYAETLLINAEAKAELNTITNADLDRTVNQLRDRVGMPHLTVNVGFTDPKWPDWGYSLSPVLQEIRRERCIELAGEGFRFNDLKRWKAGKLLNNVLTYVGKRKPDGNLAIVYPNYTNPDLSYQAGKSRTWEDKMYLYPIPTGELQRNPQLLPQNPGW